MRVGMVVSNPLVADPRVFREATSAASYGHEVTVFCWDREGAHPRHEKVNGFQIVRLRVRGTYGRGSSIANQLSFIGFWLLVGWHLIRRSHDVVHCHDLDTCPVGYLAARLRRRPIIFDAHEAYSQYDRFHRNVAGLLVRRLERFMARHADAVITVNQMMGDFFSHLRGGPVIVAHNYPDADMVAELLKLPARDRKIDPRGGADLVVGYIGSMAEDARVDLIIEAIGRLDLRPGAPRVDLYLVGSVVPSWESALDDLLAALPPGRTTRVRTVPYTEVPQHYGRIDVTVIVDEPGGNNERSTSLKLFESMAAARPAVIRPIGDMPEIVTSSGCGAIIETDEPDELAEVLSDLAQNPQKRQELGRRGREAVLATYTWEPEAAKIEGLYQDLGLNLK